MDRLFRNVFLPVSFLGLATAFPVHAFELLSEGAMGTVSAVSANSAEDIVNIAGPTAAGLTVDDDYEVLPFQTDITIEDANPDEVTDVLEFALTQEVESWASNLTIQDSLVGADTSADVSYVDELPPSSFEDAVFLVRDDEFDSIVFDSDSDQEDNTSYELSRIEQTVTVLEQNLGSIRYIVERQVDFVATIAPPDREGQEASIGSGYISDLTSISNVRIATVRD